MRKYNTEEKPNIRIVAENTEPSDTINEELNDSSNADSNAEELDNKRV